MLKSFNFSYQVFPTTCFYLFHFVFLLWSFSPHFPSVQTLTLLKFQNQGLGISSKAAQEIPQESLKPSSFENEEKEMAVVKETRPLVQQRLRFKRALLIISLNKYFGSREGGGGSEVAFALLSQQLQVQLSAFPRIFLKNY